MTQPRMVRPGATYLITRRTLRRHHLFRPDAAMSNLFAYCLAVSAARHGIRVHAAVLMSTHEHLVVSDPRGVLPAFLRDLHRWVALGTKALRRWEGAVWDHEPTSVVELRTWRAVVEKCAYALVNPVLAGLVRSYREWPGVTLAPCGPRPRALRATRPSVFFDAENRAWPATAELRLAAMPTLGAAISDAELDACFASELDRQQSEARAAMRARGHAFLGADRCLRSAPARRAMTREPVRARNPAFAVGRGQLEALRDAIAELREFRRAYRDALTDWRAGSRHSVFPPGTWWMRFGHGAAVAS